jgi:cellulose synthase/poly-beta-1,6-N-acetylglucosamine synthase-like glycosyltransferase
VRSTDRTSIEVGFRDIGSGIPSIRNKAGPPMLSTSKVSIGVIVRNEEKNILNLLQSLSIQELYDFVIDEIIVVSSGSKDETDRFVCKYGEKNSRVRLVVQDIAKGKTSGINEFLKKSKNDIVIISSGDVIFNERAIQNLVSPLIRDERVGLTSAKPVPVNDSHSFMGTVAEIHWRLHYALERHGETIAFRKSLINHIPDEVSADEAYVEAVVHQRAFKTVRVSDSLVFNKGPDIVVEFLNQIRRHYAGHLFIKAQESYLVSSMTLNGSAKIVRELLNYLSENPNKSYQVVAYVLLEGLGRVLGIWDFYVRKRHYRVWNAAHTTKILNKKNITGS